MTIWIYRKKASFNKKLQITYKQYKNSTKYGFTGHGPTDYSSYHINFGHSFNGNNSNHNNNNNSDRDKSLEFISMPPSNIQYFDHYSYDKHGINGRKRNRSRSKSPSFYKKGQNMVPRHIPFDSIISNEIGFKLFADHLVRELAVEGLLFLYHFMKIKHKLLEYNIIKHENIGLFLPICKKILSKSTSYLISPELRPVAGNEFSVSFGAGNHTPQAEGAVDLWKTQSFVNLTPHGYQHSNAHIHDGRIRKNTLSSQYSYSKSFDHENEMASKQIHLSPVREELDKETTDIIIDNNHDNDNGNTLTVKKEKISIVVTPVVTPKNDQHHEDIENEGEDIKEDDDDNDRDQEILDKTWNELSPFGEAVEAAKKKGAYYKNKETIKLQVMESSPISSTPSISPEICRFKDITREMDGSDASTSEHADYDMMGMNMNKQTQSYNLHPNGSNSIKIKYIQSSRSNSPSPEPSPEPPPISLNGARSNTVNGEDNIDNIGRLDLDDIDEDDDDDNLNGDEYQKLSMDDINNNTGSILGGLNTLNTIHSITSMGSGSSVEPLTPHSNDTPIPNGNKFDDGNIIYISSKTVDNDDKYKPSPKEIKCKFQSRDKLSHHLSLSIEKGQIGTKGNRKRTLSGSLDDEQSEIIGDNKRNNKSFSGHSLKIKLPSINPASPHLVHTISNHNSPNSPNSRNSNKSPRSRSNGDRSNGDDNETPKPIQILFKQHSLNTRIPIFDTYSCFRMLFDRYILSDSVMTVNIDSECRSQLIEIFTSLQMYYDQISEPKQSITYKNTVIDKNGWNLRQYIKIFDEAAVQVYRLLSSDPFIRFTGTEEYVEFHSMIYRNKKKINK